jgi:hypothetical protein
MAALASKTRRRAAHRGTIRRRRIEKPGAKQGRAAATLPLAGWRLI